MVQEFKARSGRVVKQGEDGSLSIDHKRGYLSPEVVMDVEEWAQAKRDAELGRWRYPEDPGIVVYGDRTGKGAFAGVEALVVHESWGASFEYSSYLEGKWDEHEMVFVEAARAYFDANPERKPWESAQPGEVWALTRNGVESAWIAGSGDTAHLFLGPDMAISKVRSDITAGRCVWGTGVVS